MHHTSTFGTSWRMRLFARTPDKLFQLVSSIFLMKNGFSISTFCRINDNISEAIVYLVNHVQKIKYQSLVVLIHNVYLSLCWRNFEHEFSWIKKACHAVVQISRTSFHIFILTSGTYSTLSRAYGRSIEIPSNLKRISGTFALLTQWISDTSGLLLSMSYNTTKKSSCVDRIP